MTDSLLLNTPLFAWIILPILIFLARVVDVSLGTVRVIFVARGMKYAAPLIGFFEILVWILAIGQIMKNLSNPMCYVAYAAGFAAGNYVGMAIVEGLSLGVVLVRVITQREASTLVGFLKDQGYGVTAVDGEGAHGPVKVVFTVIRRKEVKRVVELIKRFNPRAFYCVEEVGSVEKGVFAPGTAWHNAPLLRVLRPFRKAK
jgi:uncharacterized protein YebE (UPF0316 family)